MYFIYEDVCQNWTTSPVASVVEVILQPAVSNFNGILAVFCTYFLFPLFCTFNPFSPLGSLRLPSSHPSTNEGGPLMILTDGLLDQQDDSPLMQVSILISHDQLYYMYKQTQRLCETMLVSLIQPSPSSSSLSSIRSSSSQMINSAPSSARGKIVILYHIHKLQMLYRNVPKILQ